MSFMYVLNLARSTNKLVVELFQRRRPLNFSFFNCVQFLFHARRVSLVEEIVEAALDQKVADGRSQVPSDENVPGASRRTHAPESST